MFYNLKIYSKDCEFSLDSKDRDIIQREMDLYFSVFFGASVDFNSKIKKINVSKPMENLKSIEDIEHQNNKIEKEKENEKEPPIETFETFEAFEVAKKENKEALKPADKEELKIEKPDNSISISNEEISDIKDKIDDFLFKNDEDNIKEQHSQKEIEITNVPNINELKIASNEGVKITNSAPQKQSEAIVIKNEKENEIEPKEKEILTKEERKELEEILFSNDNGVAFVDDDDDDDENNDDEIDEIEENNTSIQDILSQAKSKLNSLNISSDDDRFENVSNLEKFTNKPVQKIKNEEPKEKSKERLEKDVQKEFDFEIAPEKNKSEIKEAIEPIEIKNDPAVQNEPENNELENKAQINAQDKKASWAEDFEIVQEKSDVLENSQTLTQEPVDLPQEVNFDPSEISKTKNNDSSIEVLYDRDAIEKSNQSKLDNIFDFKGTIFGDNNDNKKENESISETSSNSFSFGEIKEDKSPYEIPSENLFEITSEKTDAPTATPREINLEEGVPKENKDILQNTQQNVSPKEEIKKDVHDFSDFLANFEHSKIADEFLICAYYIKNISQNESFTMKGINAKIFRATGKIAGMSILNELIEKKLIALVEDLDIKKYSITELGEEYFMNNFQK